VWKFAPQKKVGRHRDISIDNFIIQKCIWHPICTQQHNLLPVYRISTHSNAQWLMRQKSVQFVAQIMWEYGIRDSVHNILCCSCTVPSIHSSVLMRHKLFKSAEFRAETNQQYNILNYDKETIAHCLLQTVLVLMIYPQKIKTIELLHILGKYICIQFAHKRFVADHIQY
jgi:hypothetical protein